MPILICRKVKNPYVPNTPYIINIFIVISFRKPVADPLATLRDHLLSKKSLHKRQVIPQSLHLIGWCCITLFYFHRWVCLYPHPEPDQGALIICWSCLLYMKFMRLRRPNVCVLSTSINHIVGHALQTRKYIILYLIENSIVTSKEMFFLLL